MPDAAGAGEGEAKTRVILVEDEGLFRDLLRVSLAQSGRVEVVGDFADGESALAAAPVLRPHVAIVDIELGKGMHGIRAGRLLRRRVPGMGIVLLSNHRDPEYLASVPEDEIAGWSYLLKPSVGDLAALVRAIEGAAAGFVVLDPEIVRRARPRPQGRLAGLSPRQLEILGLIAEGRSNAAIARELGLALKTVENQVNLIFQELAIGRDDACQPRVQAVLAYLRESRCE